MEMTKQKALQEAQRMTDMAAIFANAVQVLKVAIAAEQEEVDRADQHARQREEAEGFERRVASAKTELAGVADSLAKANATAAAEKAKLKNETALLREAKGQIQNDFDSLKADYEEFKRKRGL